MELVAPPCAATSRQTCSSNVAVAATRSNCRANARSPASAAIVTSRSKLVTPLLSTASRRLQVCAASSNDTSFSFEEVLEKSELPILVDFYATWCGPCQLMVPILSDVEKKLQGVIKVMKIDTEKYPAVASKYEIEALPTFILFKDGQPIDRVYGALPAAKLEGRIRAALDSCKASV